MERSEHKEKKLFKRFQDQCPLRMPLYDYSYIGLKKKRFINDKKISIIGEFSYNLACKNYIAFDIGDFQRYTNGMYLYELIV